MADRGRGLTDPGEGMVRILPVMFFVGRSRNLRNANGPEYPEFYMRLTIRGVANAPTWASIIMSVGGAKRSHSVDARPFTPLEHPFFAGKYWEHCRQFQSTRRRRS